MADVDKDADPKKSKLENEPDHVAHEPAKTHDPVSPDAHAKVAEHGEVIGIIPENSWQDMVLQLCTAVAGLGLIAMMIFWSSFPLAEVSQREPTEPAEQHNNMTTPVR